MLQERRWRSHPLTQAFTICIYKEEGEGYDGHPLTYAFTTLPLGYQSSMNMPH